MMKSPSPSHPLATTQAQRVPRGPPLGEVLAEGVVERDLGGAGGAARGLTGEEVAGHLRASVSGRVIAVPANGIALRVCSSLCSNTPR